VRLVGHVARATDHRGSIRSVVPARRRPHRRRVKLAVKALSVLVAVAGGLSAGIAVLFPATDSPDRVEAIVVVAGANDDRYVYARHLAEEGGGRPHPSVPTAERQWVVRHRTRLLLRVHPGPRPGRAGSRSSALHRMSTPPRARPRPPPGLPAAGDRSRYWWCRTGATYRGYGSTLSNALTGRST
jgi:hypothetical protein